MNWTLGVMPFLAWHFWEVRVWPEYPLKGHSGYTFGFGKTEESALAKAEAKLEQMQERGRK